MRKLRRFSAIAAAILTALSGSAAGNAQQDAMEIDPDAPGRHFTLPNPARLSGAEAEETYQRIRPDMVAAYRLTELPAASAYVEWQRYNRVPYRSTQHGDRYINHYANDTAGAYGRITAGETMPVGSVIAKDSFAVTEDGGVFTGPLFLMEKMPAGFAPADGDWRYTMIMPDGSVFGQSRGPGARRVEFCARCHNNASGDRLFFIPRRYRAEGN